MAIGAQGLTREFTHRVAGAIFTTVEPVDLQVECSELALLKGRSGSGENTLMSIPAGVLALTIGRVLLGGEDLYSLSKVELSSLHDEEIGLAPQGYAALRPLGVVGGVVLLAVLSTKGAVGPKWGLEFLEAMGVSVFAGASPSELLGRKLRRMGVVRTLMMDPKVVLTGEPTAGLDRGNAMMVFKMLRRTANGNRVVMVATHEEGTTHLTDQMLHMVEGYLRENGRRQEKDRIRAEGGASKARIGLQIRGTLSARARAGRTDQRKGALRARAGAHAEGCQRGRGHVCQRLDWVKCGAP